MARKLAVCQFVLQECPFGRPAWAAGCVRNFCDGRPFNFGSCGAAIVGAPAACCSGANPASCLANYQKAMGYDGSKFSDACADLRYAVNRCAFWSSNFTQGYNAQASCLCYDSAGQYAPDEWQSDASACYASGAKAHPTIYSLLAADSSAGLQLCTKYAGPSAVSATVAVTGLAAMTTSIPATGTGGASVTSAPSVSSTAAVNGTRTSTTVSSNGSGIVTSPFSVKRMVVVLGLVLPGLMIGAF